MNRIFFILLKLYFSVFLFEFSCISIYNDLIFSKSNRNESTSVRKDFTTPETKLLVHYFHGKQNFCPEFEWQIKNVIFYGTDIIFQLILPEITKEKMVSSFSALLHLLPSHSFLSSKCRFWLCSLDSLSLPRASTFYKLLLYLWQHSSQIAAAGVPHHNLLSPHP